jgi:hypothetical protein
LRYAKREEHDNQPLITSWKFLGDSTPELYWVA